MMFWRSSLSALCLALPLAAAQSDVVIVTGATGRTGAKIYGMLKEKGVNVRGLVRNASKARDVLACTKCDESEGIFVADITKPETLVAPMAGTSTLVITTSAIPVCNPYPDCHYPKGGLPIDVDWKGGKAQVTAFAQQAQGKGQVAMVSSMGTTEPDGFLEKLDNGHIGFYKLNLESFLMSSGLKYTIVKPCGLDDGPGTANNTLVVGHDDELHLTPPTVARADVARVVVAALQHQDVADGLRFDLCSKAGPATSDSDLIKVLQDAKYSWQKASADIQI
jgi:hypothetical protein